VVHVGNVDVAVRRDRHVARHVEVGRGGRAAVADVAGLVAGGAVAGDRVDESGVVIDHPDAIVQRVRDEDVAVRRHRDAAGAAHRGVGGWLVVAVVAGLAVAGDRRDDRGRLVDAADPFVVRVGDDQVAVRSDRDAVGGVELRRRRHAEVAGKPAAERVVAGDRGDVLLERIDAANHVVVRVGKVDVAGAGDCDAARRVEPGVDRRSVVAGVALAGADHLRGGDLAQHERAGAEAEDHHEERRGGAQAVDAQQRRRDERHPRRPRLHLHHLLLGGDGDERALHDRGRLRRPPCHIRGDEQREGGGDGARQRPAQRDAGARRSDQRRADRERRQDAQAGRPQVRAGAQQALASGVLLDQRAQVEPGPAAGEDAHVAVVRPPFVDVDHPHRSRSPQPVGELRQHPVGARPALAPVAILGHRAGDQQERPPPFRERRARTAAGLPLGDRQRHFGRRQHPANHPAQPRERLDEVQVGDGRAIPEAVAGQRGNVRSPGIRHVLRERRRDPDQAGAEQNRGRPAVPAGRRYGNTEHRQRKRQELPAERVRQECERVDVGPVHRREGRRAPDSCVDPLAPQRSHERQRAVDAPVPQHAAVEELLRMMRHQPALALAVADLLTPVGLDRRAMVVPDERRRGKPDFPAARLQPPAHVHIVAGAQVDRIEAANREERVAAERHVAAGDVLGDAIVEQDVRRPARRPRNALRHRRVVRRHHVRAARSDDLRRQERLDEVG
jgi:hypothetical protein